MKKFSKKTSSNLKASITSMLDLPKEIMLNLPLLTIIGTDEVMIENYKGVIEYSAEKIRIKTTCGTLKLEGKRLILKEITSENISITGKILKYEYIL